jgi:hypothetical protein
MVMTGRTASPQNRGNDFTMTRFTKIAATALTALTIAAGALSVSTEAQAGPKKWGPVGVGIGLGLLATGIIAEAAYANSRRCEVVDQFNAYGEYVGSRKVCYGY